LGSDNGRMIAYGLSWMIDTKSRSPSLSPSTPRTRYLLPLSRGNIVSSPEPSAPMTTHSFCTRTPPAVRTTPVSAQPGGSAGAVARPSRAGIIPRREGALYQYPLPAVTQENSG
jgi:hypothetical protein